MPGIVALTALLCVFPTAFALAAPTPAARPKAQTLSTISPHWKADLLRGAHPNSSYLTALPPKDSEDGAWNSRALPERTQARMKQRYEDLTRDYERKKLYQQLDRADEEAQVGRMNEFSGMYMRSIVAHQFSESLKEAEKNSEDVRTFRSVHESVGALAKGSTSVQVVEEMKIGTRTDLPARRGQVWMKTPLMQGALDVQFGRSGGFDPWSISGRESLSPIDERYVLSVSKDLPVFDLQSSLSYGMNSTRRKTALRKALSSKMRVEVSDSRGSDPVRSGLPAAGEQKLQLEYGIQF
jgi:hypothetical protein